MSQPASRGQSRHPPEGRVSGINNRGQGRNRGRGRGQPRSPLDGIVPRVNTGAGGNRAFTSTGGNKFIPSVSRNSGLNADGDT